VAGGNALTNGLLLLCCFWFHKGCGKPCTAAADLRLAISSRVKQQRQRILFWRWFVMLGLACVLYAASEETKIPMMPTAATALKLR
jgi:hypothetical protein